MNKFKRYPLTWTIKTLCNQMKKGKVDFNHAAQRNLVWDMLRKSLLIHSIIIDFPINCFYFSKQEDGVYKALECKQRSNAIYDFVNNEFALSEDTPPVYDDEGNEEDISGCTFDGLPEWVRDTILSYSLTAYHFEDMSDEDEREFICRINNGKVFTAMDTMRIKAASIDDYQELGKHDAITAILTAAGARSRVDEVTAMQIHAMLSMENAEFDTKGFGPWLEATKMTEDEKASIFKGLDYAYELINHIKASLECDSKNKTDKRVLAKVRKRLNFVCVAYAGILAVQNDVNIETFVTSMYRFFDCLSTTMDNEYNSATGSGTGKAEAVCKRREAIKRLVASM